MEGSKEKQVVITAVKIVEYNAHGVEVHRTVALCFTFRADSKHIDSTVLLYAKRGYLVSVSHS